MYFLLLLLSFLVNFLFWFFCLDLSERESYIVCIFLLLALILEQVDVFACHELPAEETWLFGLLLLILLPQLIFVLWHDLCSFALLLFPFSAINSILSGLLLLLSLQITSAMDKLNFAYVSQSSNKVLATVLSLNTHERLLLFPELGYVWSSIMHAWPCLTRWFLLRLVCPGLLLLHVDLSSCRIEIPWILSHPCHFFFFVWHLFFIIITKFPSLIF